MNKRMKEIGRFWSKVKKSDKGDCWQWQGSLSQKGYGTFYIYDPNSANGMKAVKAHRYAYGMLNGGIPDGRVVDHTCFNRGCVNPKHLRVLTAVENSKRANRVPVTHCKRGHEFTDKNTEYHSITGGRVCIACKRLYQQQWMRDYREKYKALAKA